MAEKFPIAAWNYNTLEEIAPDEVNVWADCGLTVTMSPVLYYGKDDPKMLIPYLDIAEKRGIKLIANVRGLELDNVISLGEEKYAERFKEVLSEIRHPALYGFYVGDEPSEKEMFEASVTCVKIQKTIAPDLRPYLNLHTCMDDTDPELLGGRNFRQWLFDFAKETGFKNFSYGHYDQIWDERGINSHFKNLKALSEAAEGAGVDLWNTMLSSPHYMFRIPTEYDFTWQITTAAACGSRGIVWFRLYDRILSPNYHCSPIDEYGNKTEQYYKLLRANRRFQDHYGELIMSLKHKSTYLTYTPYGGYNLFGKNTHPVITDINGTEPAVVSFFTAEDGTEYLCLVNSSMEKPGVYKIEFDNKAYKLEEVLFNGATLSEYEHKNTDEHWDGQWLYPGQMNMFRITKR